MSADKNKTQDKVMTLRMPDNYVTHCRIWGEPEGEDVIIFFHGGMSHSLWQAPLAEALLRSSDISFVAPDRRGSGLNTEAKGDLKTAEAVIDDIVTQVRYFKKSFSNVHLAGWCQGAQYISTAGAQIKDSHLISSLILLTPGFFWSEHFSSVIEVVQMVAFSLICEFQINPAPDHAFAPVPLLPRDFTSNKKWLDFIKQDDLKTTHITLNANNIMNQLQEASIDAIREIDIPVLSIFATQDRIADTQRGRTHMEELLSRNVHNKISTFDSHHAIHFEKPDELAKEILSFLSTLKTDRQN